MKKWMILLSFLVAVVALSGLVQRRAVAQAHPAPGQTALSRKHLTPTPSIIPSPLPTARVCTGVAGGFLHIRLVPGADQPIIGWLAEGTPVVLTGRQDLALGGLWTEIEIADGRGWVNDRYVCGGQDG